MSLVAGSSASGTGLAGAIYTHLTSTSPPMLAVGAVNGQKFVDAIAAAVVAYLTANAVILPTALVAPNGGGPVTGTGTLL